LPANCVISNEPAVSFEMREAYAALPDKLIALYKQPEQEIR